jgi:hypothetical protein
MFRPEGEPWVLWEGESLMAWWYLIEGDLQAVGEFRRNSLILLVEPDLWSVGAFLMESYLFKASCDA